MESQNKDFNEVVAFTVEGAKLLKNAKADGKVDAGDLMLIGPVLLAMPAAIKDMGKAFHDLKIEDVVKAAVEILEAAGEFDGKAKLYVEKSVSIIGHLVGIVSDVKDLKEGVPAEQPAVVA